MSVSRSALLLCSVCLCASIVRLELPSRSDTRPQLPSPAPRYEKTVLPLLTARCGGCHSGGGSAGFDIRTVGSVLHGGKSGAAVLPGNPEGSLLFKLVVSGKMPPSPPALTKPEIQTIALWIRRGAVGSGSHQGHWAFTPPRRSPPPAGLVPYGPIPNPIDRFLLRGLKSAGLTYSPEADRRTLIRRLTIDLIGLPPTPEEVQAYLADKRPDAYSRVVDRLLADNRYGERWARFWLDTAGYADSEGVLEEDRIRPNAWRFRDYVIRALNQDKPYDTFVREQIAGDELSEYKTSPVWTPQIDDAVTATGFLRTAVDATRDDFNTHQFVEYQYRMLHDTQTILISTTLGITLQCARCHDHKYEPFTQRDYYSIQATLLGAIRPEGKLLPTSRRQIPAATEADQKRTKDTNARIDLEVTALDQLLSKLQHDYRLLWVDAKINTIPQTDRVSLMAAARLEAARQTAAQTALVAKYKSVAEPTNEVLLAEYPAYKQSYTKAEADKASALKQRVAIPEIRGLYDQDNSPPVAHVLLRGEYSHPGETVTPGIPQVLATGEHLFQITPRSATSMTTGRRLALANWITRTDNPLTARVEVNRIWAHHFGVGLVSTVENLGKSGAVPSNQPLLDWLSVAFSDGVNSSRPWTRKALHRLIVTSEAYRQSSTAANKRAEIFDPEDKLLWRQRSRRMEAEALRDSILQTAGTLDAAMYGEPVDEKVQPSGEVVVNGEDGVGRRSIYLLVRRSKPVTLLNAFDAPVMETNCTRRTTSTTPTQALALMNGSFLAAQAQHMSDRVAKECAHQSGRDDESTVERAYLLSLQRTPSALERSATMAFLITQRSRYEGTGKTRPASARLTLADLCLALLSTNEFAYVD